MTTKILIALALALAGCKKSASTRPGPKVAWRATVDKDMYDAIALGGAFVTVGKTGVTAFRDGKAVWMRTLDAEPSAWLVPLGDAVLAGDDKGGLYALAQADGSVTWKTTTPVPDGDSEAPWVKEAAVNNGRIVLLDSSMRFVVLDPKACAAKAETCTTLSGELASGASDPEHFTVMADGTRIVSGFSWLTMFSPTGERISSFMADDLLGGISTTHGLVVAHDRGVVRIDPAKCKVEGGKFRLGKREDRDEPPGGCVETIHGGPVSAFEPVASKTAVAWVHDDDELRGTGTKAWHIPMEKLHRASQMVADGDTAYVACWVEPKGDDVFVTVTDLCAVALDTGAIRWRSQLGLSRAGIMDSPWIVVGSDAVYVVLKDQVAALPKQ